MSSNKVVINDSADYTFEVSDEVCDSIVALCQTGKMSTEIAACQCCGKAVSSGAMFCSDECARKGSNTVMCNKFFGSIL